MDEGSRGLTCVEQKIYLLVGIKIYINAQFEKAQRYNVDYDKTGRPRKAVRYQSPVFDTK